MLKYFNANLGNSVNSYVNLKSVLTYDHKQLNSWYNIFKTNNHKRKIVKIADRLFAVIFFYKLFLLSKMQADHFETVGSTQLLSAVLFDGESNLEL